MKQTGSRGPISGCFTAANWPAIHQIYYQDVQVPHLDKDLIPYRNVANLRPEWCEYSVFRKEYLAGNCDCGLTGFVSWKFGQKTGIRGDHFRSWILAHPGYDVYFVNPFPQLARGKFRSVWHHGSSSHPDIVPLAQLLIDKAGYRLNLESLRMDERVTAYCNYWVATPVFWRRYMDFCEPIHDVVENGLSRQEKARILAVADQKSGCCYIPYIFERLFSTLLWVEKDIRSLRMPLPGVEDGKHGGLPWYRKFLREIYRPYTRMKGRRADAFRAAS